MKWVILALFIVIVMQVVAIRKMEECIADLSKEVRHLSDNVANLPAQIWALNRRTAQP